MLTPKATARTAQDAEPIAVMRAIVLSGGRWALTRFNTPNKNAASDDPRDQMKIPLKGGVPMTIKTFIAVVSTGGELCTPEHSEVLRHGRPTDRERKNGLQIRKGEKP